LIFLSKKDNLDTYFFLTLKKNFNKKDFLRKAKVRKGSFAENLISRLFEVLRHEVIDINAEFKKYYRKEYESLQIFLDKKYNLNKKLTDKIVEANNKGYKIFLGVTPCSGDTGLSRMIFSDSFLEKLNGFLEKE